MSSLTGSNSRKPTGGYPLTKIKGFESAQVPNFSPEQMQLFQQLIAGLQPGIGKGLEHLSGLAGGDQSKFAELEAPALRQFSGLMGGLSSRFSGGAGGPGGTSARRSSGFNLESSAAGQNFAEGLQSQRLGLQNNAISQLMGLSQSLLGQRPYENLYMDKKKPFWQDLLLSLSGGIGQAGGAFGLKQLGL